MGRLYGFENITPDIAVKMFMGEISFYEGCKYPMRKKDVALLYAHFIRCRKIRDESIPSEWRPINEVIVSLGHNLGTIKDMAWKIVLMMNEKDKTDVNEQIEQWKSIGRVY